MSRSIARRLPVGAEARADGSTHFRVWAPQSRAVTVAIVRADGLCGESALSREAEGYFSACVRDVNAGDTYQYRVNGDLLADPASRFQPDGPFGPSQVVNPSNFAWTDGDWRGVTLPGQIIYEMHVGTFTPEGTWEAAMDRLPLLARTGVTMLEIMPIAEFPGRFGWGYDGVFPYAPTRLYGTPSGFRTFVNRAHHLGLAVILDVVYNHLGPDGCVFRRYSPQYFTKKYDNEWGDALNFDADGCGPVREYFACNAAYWIDEYHLDGVRLDATQSIHDSSDEHIIATIARRARRAAVDRSIVIVAENERNEARLIRPTDKGGYGLDAVWNDDFHHSAAVAMTGRREAYFTDHRGTPQEFISAAKYGYLFQGQRYAWQQRPRGTRAACVGPAAFVNFIENHDQLANSGHGTRVWSGTIPGTYRAMTALVLLLPGTPMIFQGQEFGASTPFLYFADHRKDLAADVAKGRAEFIAQFPSLGTAEIQSRLPSPHDPSTFDRCTLRWEEYHAHSTHRRLHEDLIAMRRGDVAFRAQRPGVVDGAVLAAEAFVLRYATASAQDERIVIVNLGPDLHAGSFAEPLVAPPEGFDWTLRWSSEHPDYGGGGTPEVISRTGWHIPAHSAVVFRPENTHDVDGANRH